MIDTFSIRCGVLRLAFSGKLTDQRDEDGTAPDILNKIDTKKPITEIENGPYSIPASWAWVRLADLYKVNPKVEADDNIEAAFIPMERISGGFDREFTFKTQKWEIASKNHTKFEDGDVAFAKITPCFENRKSFIAYDLPNGIGGGTTELIILRQKEMLPEYTYYLVLDERFISTGVSSYKGVVGQQRVQSNVIKNYLVPVAPYPEQKRIVEKIEQAFSVLDTIDELQAQYADNLTALKSKLIDAAIQGKLTEQLPEDGTAEELYQQIQAEKQRQISEGKIKKQKPLPEITEQEIPFDIPDNWKWVRLGCICYSVFAGKDKPEDFVKEKDEEHPIPVVANAVTNDGIMGYTSVATASAGTLTVAGRGTIGFTCYRDYDYCPIVRLLVINQSSLIFPQYIKYVFQRLTVDSVGSSIPQLTVPMIRPKLIPLPPLAEQKRIVQKLEEILPSCESLK